MTKWYVYKHFCRFIHNVKDADWLVDKACLTPHEHGFDPNPPCIIEFIVAPDRIMDFKVLKAKATKCVSAIANKEEVKNGMPYYDFGTMDTEAMTDDLKKLLLAELNALGYKARVQIWLDETKKYSIWDDGEDETNYNQFEHKNTHELDCNCFDPKDYTKSE